MPPLQTHGFMELAAVLPWNLFAGPRAPADVSDVEPASREGIIGMTCTPIGPVFVGSGSSSFLSYWLAQSIFPLEIAQLLCCHRHWRLICVWGWNGSAVQWEWGRGDCTTALEESDRALGKTAAPMLSQTLSLHNSNRKQSWSNLKIGTGPPRLPGVKAYRPCAASLISCHLCDLIMFSSLCVRSLSSIVCHEAAKAFQPPSWST